jgi:hypothetical protein
MNKIWIYLTTCSVDMWYQISLKFAEQFCGWNVDREMDMTYYVFFSCTLFKKYIKSCYKYFPGKDYHKSQVIQSKIQVLSWKKNVYCHCSLLWKDSLWQLLPKILMKLNFDSCWKIWITTSNETPNLHLKNVSCYVEMLIQFNIGSSD